MAESYSNPTLSASKKEGVEIVTVSDPFFRLHACDWELSEFGRMLENRLSEFESKQAEEKSEQSLDD